MAKRRTSLYSFSGDFVFKSSSLPPIAIRPSEAMAVSKNATASLLISRRLALPFLLLISLPIFLGLILASWPADFDPSPLPVSYGFRSSAAAAEQHNSVLGVSERVGEGLLGPEDLAYDEKEGVLYAGCYDGWIRKVRVGTGKDEKVEDWVKVGGRPLGIAFAPDGSLAVAEPYRGLLKVNRNGEIKLLADEAEGKKFKLTDGVDVASNGVIYFTDASYKYDLELNLLDNFEGRPYGRLLSFDPSTNQTTVLLRDLYFANGVSLSPDQQSLIFCETPLWRCRRYYIEGEKKEATEDFVDNLPGFPDNVRYDGDGHYVIGLAVGRTLIWDLLMKYPLLRKLKVVLGMHVNFPSFKNSGLLIVNLEGKPEAVYKDSELSFVTGGFKIGKHLYFCSLFQKYLLRIDITKLAAKA